MNDLTKKTCVPCEGGVAPLTTQEAKNLLTQVPQWVINDNCTEISRDFSFKDYFHTMDFVNKVASIADQENHHPTMVVGYGKCLVRYQTHATNGLSENDFICAAKVDTL